MDAVSVILFRVLKRNLKEFKVFTEEKKKHLLHKVSSGSGACGWRWVGCCCFLSTHHCLPSPTFCGPLLLLYHNTQLACINSCPIIASMAGDRWQLIFLGNIIEWCVHLISPSDVVAHGTNTHDLHRFIITPFTMYYLLKCFNKVHTHTNQ